MTIRVRKLANIVGGQFLPALDSKQHRRIAGRPAPQQSEGRPVFWHGYIVFQNRLFVPDREPLSTTEREEVLLRTKKAVYEEDTELAALRSSVANLEAAISYRKSGPKRDLIPDDVKLRVWARDGGACVNCAASSGLQFDHVIPVAKGGGNTAANIQLLCQSCNLRKSDKIAMP